MLLPEGAQQLHKIREQVAWGSVVEEQLNNL
jgi:hypothetical protein